jgi:hypothetical protein
VKFVVEAMAETGAEPIYSMGDDIPIASLGRTPRRVYGYLRQRFAQVTNPAIDPLREKAVMSLRVLLGPRRRTLEPEGGVDRELRRQHHPAVPTVASLLELDSPVLGAAELARVLEEATVLDATYAPDESLRDALFRLRSEAGEVDGVIALSDRRTGPDRLPVPMALAVGAELGLAAVLQDQTVAEYIGARDKVSGSVYLVMLGVFALMPRFRY